MSPKGHILVSAATGGAVWAATGEPWAVPLALVAGVLVDVDHIPDYFWTLVLRRGPRLTVALHAWEWFAILLGALVILGGAWWMAAIAAGYGLHLAGDQIRNRPSPLGLSITWRALHRFRTGAVDTEFTREAAWSGLRREAPPLAWALERLARRKDLIQRR